MLGAILGGLAVAYAPVVFPKVSLGCVLLVAAGKTTLHRPEPVSRDISGFDNNSLGSKQPAQANGRSRR
jgi:uncharacterized membrane protein YfcA